MAVVVMARRAPDRDADPAAPPIGAVTLTEGSTVIATVQVSQPFNYEGVPNQAHNIAVGNYTLLLRPGTHHLTATYNATADFAASAASLDVPIAPLNLVIYPTMPGQPAVVTAIDTHDHRYFHLNVMAGSGPTRAWLICDDPDHTWLRESWEHQQIDPRLPLHETRGV